MFQMRKAIHAISVLLLFGCAAAPVQADMTAEQAIAAAKEAQAKADSVQGGWISTDRLIRKAKLAVLRGETDAALQYAKRAKREAELAYRQAEHERKHWSPPPYALSK